MMPGRPLKAILLALLLAPALAADDGPYVFWKGAEARVLQFHQGEARETALPAPYLLELEGLPALQLDPRPPRPAAADLPAPARMAAVSDPHGHLDNFVALLQAQGILDARRRWAFGTGHLVVLGDVFDKGTQVTELFWLLRSMEAQALAAGGRSHLVLGNHEVTALRGDSRSLDPKYRALGRLPSALYGPDSELGRWLRACPVLLRLGDTLFVHGGPCPALLDQERSLEACNQAFRTALDHPGRHALLTKRGPVRYSGMLPVAASSYPDATDLEVDTVLEGFQARRIVVGHITLERIKAFHQGQVFGIDAGLQDDEPGELWLSLDGRRYRGLADGTRPPLP